MRRLWPRAAPGLMGAYLVRRLLLVIPTLFGIIAINFVVVQFAPGGPVEQMIAELKGRGGGVTGRMTGAGAAEAMPVGNGAYRGARGLDPHVIADIRKMFGFGFGGAISSAKRIEMAGDLVRIAGRGVVMKDEEADSKVKIEQAFASAGLKVPALQGVLAGLKVDRTRAQKIVTRASSWGSRSSSYASRRWSPARSGWASESAP